ncbi:MAG TPA: hemolysin III family protein [Candidatus Eisenbergiella merdigallinarum]|uniref:Hemolysin III family protein n=1 Tax=Candidatus Eisenbergiella merdigallinarum TaxID=2838552 RepID=A0A9D2SDE6_9FIRM|nr:hemolysin III family protein [Candidatus Eisenbergiella merdigallinarum]
MTIVIREPGSAITHFIAMLMALVAAAPLLIKAALTSGESSFLAMAVFMASMVLLYAASATYHSVNVPARILKIFRKVDHMMIFVLIAGTYTPVCLITLKGPQGYALLAAVWGIALAGILIKAVWITCPKWFSSILYISMGWACLSVAGQLFTLLSTPAFLWLLAGGVLYTLGGILYALKLPFFNARHRYFGSHEIFHLFVMAGSICHFIFMFGYVV